MATKQQVREQITKVIQEGILTKVLPFQPNDGEIITAQNYQAIVSGGQTGVGTAAEGEQTIIYEQDFQTAENEFNRFVNGITECYKNSEENSEPYTDFTANFGMGDDSGIIFSLGVNYGELSEANTYIAENLGVMTDLGYDCSVENLYLLDALVAITQFQSLNLTSTQIDPTQAQEILDTTIFELIGQQTTKQDRINQFFQDYTNLRSGETPTDEDGDGIADDNYDINNDISAQNPEGSIVRLNENAGDVNEDQTLEWLRDDLNRYFFDDVVDEGLPTYQERSSGYLKFREMNQAIIIRNTENQQVIPDTWIDDGFTITMWVKFKDKVSSGTLFNYGNPFRTPQENAFGFTLETYVLNGNENNKDGGADITSDGNYENWRELAEFNNLDYFDNNEQARFLRLVVKESTPHNDQNGDTILYLRDSHIGMGGLTKKHDIARADDISLSKRFLTTTNVPIDFNEWYFIVATYDPLNDETIDDDNENLPLYWTGNLQDDLSTETHHSGLGNKCKVEIISKTDLLRARGYKTQ